MAYVECKIWPFSPEEDELIHQEARWKAMKEGHRHYTVKALIKTSSNENFISKSLADKLGEKYGKHYKNKRVKRSLGTIECLEISLQYKGKDRLLANTDESYSNFEVINKPYKSDLILGMQWLRLRKAKIDVKNEGIRIYGNFIPFYKSQDNGESFYNSDSESSSSELKE